MDLLRWIKRWVPWDILLHLLTVRQAARCTLQEILPAMLGYRALMPRESSVDKAKPARNGKLRTLWPPIVCLSLQEKGPLCSLRWPEQEKGAMSVGIDSKTKMSRIEFAYHYYYIAWSCSRWSSLLHIFHESFGSCWSKACNCKDTGLDT